MYSVHAGDSMCCFGGERPCETRSYTSPLIAELFYLRQRQRKVELFIFVLRMRKREILAPTKLKRHKILEKIWKEERTNRRQIRNVDTISLPIIPPVLL